MNPEKVIEHFQIEGEVKSIRPFGEGLINTSFKVTTKSDYTPDYFLQRINQNIFPDIDALSRNMLKVTKHLHKSAHWQNALTPAPVKTGDAYYRDDKGECWRVFNFIRDSVSISKLENADQARSMGEAFAQFHKAFVDFPLEELETIIPDFHNTPLRIEKLKRSLQSDSLGRKKEIQKEADFLLGFESEMGWIEDLGKAGEIPSRIIHQDTKLSNLLFEDKGNVISIVDLDTVMPGYLCYDFGDAIRGAMNTSVEDAENGNPDINMDYFKSFAQGYMEIARSFITEKEIETLVFGGKLMCYEQAVRFLDDYLNGDQYFKVEKEKHNLIRARNQISFFEVLNTHFKEMDVYLNDLS